ncbi:hypothetical protein WN55_01220 [Dufourea novaeangliae]|uniref:Uncharacterized protein n=1 Tax=Dufourea novaeangliae TaxID=178035 RepID=A0A154NYK8_DUFNO|nr:hypothetical protein WN55_01220 [Dufourea novaeangliae]
MQQPAVQARSNEKNRVEGGKNGKNEASGERLDESRRRRYFPRILREERSLIVLTSDRGVKGVR